MKFGDGMIRAIGANDDPGYRKIRFAGRSGQQSQRNNENGHEMTEACCTPLTAPDLDEAGATELSEAFKALADPARLRLLSLIANAPEGEACACDLVAPLDRSQPTVSHHLALLVEAGLLRREKRGRWAWYRLVPERLAGLRAVLEPAGK